MPIQYNDITTHGVNHLPSYQPTAEQLRDAVIRGPEFLTEHLAEHLSSELREMEILSANVASGRLEARDLFGNVYVIEVKKVNG